MYVIIMMGKVLYGAKRGNNIFTIVSYFVIYNIYNILAEYEDELNSYLFMIISNMYQSLFIRFIRLLLFGPSNIVQSTFQLVQFWTWAMC
jgi:hypothetical protein